MENFKLRRIAHRTEIKRCIEIKTDIFFLNFKVNYVDVKYLAATQLISGIIGVKRFVCNRQYNLQRHIGNQISGRYCKCACIFSDCLLSDNCLLTLNKRENRFFVYLIPEAENRNADITIILNGFNTGNNALVVCVGNISSVSIFRFVNVFRLAVDVYALTFNAEHIGFLGDCEVGNEHLLVKVQIVIIGEVAFLMNVNVNIIYDLIVTNCRGEGNSAIFICVKIEFVRSFNKYFIPIGIRFLGVFEGIYGNDDISVLNGFVACVFNINEIIVCLYSAVGNFTYNLISSDISLAPGAAKRIVVFVFVAPSFAVLFFVISGQRSVRVIVDLFCDNRNRRRYVVNRGEVGTVAEGARTD